MISVPLEEDSDTRETELKSRVEYRFTYFRKCKLYVFPCWMGLQEQTGTVIELHRSSTQHHEQSYFRIRILGKLNSGRKWINANLDKVPMRILIKIFLISCPVPLVSPIKIFVMSANSGYNFYRNLHNSVLVFFLFYCDHNFNIHQRFFYSLINYKK